MEENEIPKELFDPDIRYMYKEISRLVGRLLDFAEASHSSETQIKAAKKITEKEVYAFRETMRQLIIDIKAREKIEE